MLHLQGQGKDKKHGERFLLAIPALCRATKQRGEDTLEPETCQVVLLQKIMTKQQKHMEDLEAMLRSLLATAPSLGRLQFLWELQPTARLTEPP
ncbi:hypothetical protein Y1Q_0001996 [Alligator mississippiensis]|uniref:Uncharacterized protein n=1 Tax=Alligator mississippiensis TaxID=8496 RepID=A0A151MNS5_ALLMI|nr:hypothetical protein Y1Q_0001996 [Alligator mississippiensis]